MALTRLGAIWREVDQRNDGATDLPLLAVSQSRGVVLRSELTEKPPRAEDLSKYKVSQKGDLVLNRFNAYRGALGVAPVTGLVSPDYLVLRPGGAATSRYLDYLLRSAPVASHLRQSMGGLGSADPDVSGFSRIDSRALNLLKVGLPPRSAQRLIVDRLDREADQIDALVGKQQQLVKTLSARRQAVIEHAVLGAGGIPGGLKLGRGYSLHNGDRGASYPSREDFVTEGVPFINAGHLSRNAVNYDLMHFITDEQYASMGGAKLRDGDLLFCLRGSLGKFGVFRGARGALASSLVALRRRTESVDDQYVAWLLSSRYTADQIAMTQTGSAQPNLSAEQLSQFKYPLPPLDVQREVASRLSDAVSRVDVLSAKAERFIALARERRAALITAAVTGQIDVRTAA